MLVMFRLSTYVYPSDPWSESETLSRHENGPAERRSLRRIGWSICGLLCTCIPNLWMCIAAVETISLLISFNAILWHEYPLLRWIAGAAPLNTTS
jgi:hypothetical protein